MSQKPLVKDAKTLTLAGGLAVLNAAIAEAKRIGQPMCVSVVDTGGNLLAFGRMYGSKALSVISTRNKAVTAKLSNEPTGGAGADVEIQVTTPERFQANGRGGLRSVPYGQIEAARACGMSRSLAYRRVILPIALRQALPSYGNEIILMIKGTSLTSIITLLDITGIAQQIISQTYRAVEVFACAGAIYLAMNYLVAHLVAVLEHRLSPHLRAPDIER